MLSSAAFQVESASKEMQRIILVAAVEVELLSISSDDLDYQRTRESCLFPNKKLGYSNAFASTDCNLGGRENGQISRYIRTRFTDFDSHLGQSQIRPISQR
jgi:hypothetical protein